MHEVQFSEEFSQVLQGEIQDAQYGVKEELSK